MTDNATSANPDLPAAKTQPGQPITTAVKHQPRHRCKASPGTGQWQDICPREELLYEIKGGSLRSPPRRIDSASSRRSRSLESLMSRILPTARPPHARGTAPADTFELAAGARSGPEGRAR